MQIGYKIGCNPGVSPTILFLGYYEFSVTNETEWVSHILCLMNAYFAYFGHCKFRCCQVLGNFKADVRKNACVANPVAVSSNAFQA